jgi:hypothetical protein
MNVRMSICETPLHRKIAYRNYMINYIVKANFRKDFVLK